MNLDYSIREVARGAEASRDHPGISWPVNLDYYVCEVARGAGASRDHLGIPWSVNLDYSVLEVARGSSQYHPRILCFLDFTKTFSDN